MRHQPKEPRLCLNLKGVRKYSGKWACPAAAYSSNVTGPDSENEDPGILKFLASAIMTYPPYDLSSRWDAGREGTHSCGPARSISHNGT